MERLRREQWKPIPGASNYEVSDQGRVRSLDSIDYIGVWPGRILEPTNYRGYPTVKLLFDDNHRQGKAVSVLVLEAFVGPRPPGKQCCHYNGIKSDNRLSNLRWDTAYGNDQDARRHGTKP